MKVLVQINTVCNGSTGKIMCSIADEIEKYGFKTYIFYGRGKGKNKNRDFKITSELSAHLHGLFARLGFDEKGSYFETKKLVRKLKKINPDIIHLHNLHGHYLNYKVLFKYLKNYFNGKIVWTLHDCWSFTGGCPHFTYVNCMKWKEGCGKCKYLKNNLYQHINIDRTRKIFILKEKYFCGLKNMTIVTPSKWLKNLVKQSFLKEYTIKVINNGVDLRIFKKYSETELNDIYIKYNIPKHKKIILGIAGIWNNKKGLKDFFDLSKHISNEYIIIMIGVTEKNIKESKSTMNMNNIIFIKRTDNQIELAKLYNIADVLYNPTYEDNFPTVNLESVACGTPVITYNSGGSPESMLNYGDIVTKEIMFKEYNKIIDKLNTKGKDYVISDKKMINNYLELYNGNIK